MLNLIVSVVYSMPQKITLWSICSPNCCKIDIYLILFQMNLARLDKWSFTTLSDLTLGFGLSLMIRMLRFGEDYAEVSMHHFC